MKRTGCTHKALLSLSLLVVLLTVLVAARRQCSAIPLPPHLPAFVRQHLRLTIHEQNQALIEAVRQSGLLSILTEYEDQEGHRSHDVTPQQRERAVQRVLSLLKHGADANTHDQRVDILPAHLSALQVALVAGFLQTRRMDETATPPNPIEPPRPIQSWFTPPLTEWVSLSTTPNPVVVQALLAYGAKVNVADNHGDTPLMKAAEDRNPQVVELLLLHGADVRAHNKTGATPLLNACLNGPAASVRLLLNAGAAVDIPDVDGLTPLMAAAQEGYLEAMRLLLSRGARIEARTHDGATALHFASYRGNTACVRLLLESEAEVNAVTKGGGTALMQAAMNNDDPSTLRLLLSHGAHINLRDATDKSALWYAVDRGAIEAVKLLLHHGAQVSIMNRAGETLMSSVRSRAKFDAKFAAILHLLQQAGAKE